MGKINIYNFLVSVVPWSGFRLTWKSREKYLILFGMLVCGIQTNALGDVPMNVKNCISADMEISGNVVLPKSCRHTATLKIRTSNTILDCQGSTIDGENKRAIGIDIDSKGNPLSNVEVRNCVILNASHRGVNIGWSESDRKKEESRSRDQLYASTPTKVRLSNVVIRDSAHEGLYIDDYVTDTLIDHVAISGSGGVGIYVEHSSKRTTITDSEIFDNGFLTKREGIAIDSSAENVVRRSRIHHNFGGGVYLYRNCSEHLAEDPRQVVRWQSTDHNQIIDNDISDGKVGIWIASRQSMDTSMMQCGNGYYAEGKFTRDSAKYNAISRNRISYTDYGVIVEDDENNVNRNSFVRIRKNGIKVGSEPRYKYLSSPVVHVEINDNSYKDVVEKVLYVGGSKAMGADE